MSGSIEFADGESLNVGYVPGRKDQALYLEQRGALTVLAFFRTEDRADECWRLLVKLARGRNVESAPPGAGGAR